MHSKKLKISVIVPVYNEIEIIEQFHKQLITALKNYKHPFEIIYIDDNSTDGTYDILQGFTHNTHIIVAKKDGIKGKAYSLIQGFSIASGDVLAMIDGDLQYPPEKIPDMVDALNKADVVIANRKDYKDTKLRKFLSRGFRNIFGRTLFGLDTDIQSGLKVFKREVYETVKFEPVSPWTFDLEFLHRAKQAGYTLQNEPITFSQRSNGASKMNVMKQSYEIGANALQIKFNKQTHFPIPPEDSDTMRGAGLTYKKKKYITHTTLPVALSAIETFSLSQKLFFILTPIVLLAAFVLIPLQAARTVVAILSVLYFIDAIFNVYVVSKSLGKDQEVFVEDNEVAALDESKLPTYTILCPLYKEAHVVPQFLEGISKLDWPKEKLDVMFLLEEDDTETIEEFNKMNLPFYARTVIVPDSQPKTKPKACNYGLSFAKGEYLVIFDAEDIPDPLQLKKAYIGFQKVPANVTCLQAKLSYYNSRQNLLTRFFTAEYALWFDITLPGLQSLNSALPLGGTSNHFQTDNLRQLQGWDPFNVTEDADLGVRLFQRGYRTAIINSTTYEEATSMSKNWLRQRSRWIKGYMQTYLVHMRNNLSFIKQKGLWHNFVFQLTVGGKILFVLLNPFMWIITMLYFAANPIFGPTMEAIYKAPISYIAVFSWIFGNFMFMYCYMIAAAKRQQWDLMKYVLLIPLYWLMMSTAAMIALYQLILKPHYWEKTLHGFHLGRKEEKKAAKAQKPIPQPAIAPVYASVATQKQRRNFTVSLPKISKPAFQKPKPSFSFKAIVNVLPLLAILNIDLVLAKMYLPAQEAQLYLIIALIGKASFLLGQFGSAVLAAALSRGKSERNHFYKLIFFTFLFHWIGFTLFGLEGQYVIPALFGDSLNGIISYMPFYMVAMLGFGVASRFSTYYLQKSNYLYVILSLATIGVFAPLIAFNNETISDFVRTLAYLGTVNLLLVLMLHISKPYAHIIENNFASLMALFDKKKARTRRVWKENQMRILIFNWRDTKHIYAGGAEVYIHELAKRWVRNGNKVTIFCGNDNKNAFYEHVDGIEIYRRGGTYTVYFFAIMYYLFKFRGKYDVIVDCENGIPFFMPLFAREQVILLIHHVHQEIFRKFLKFPMSFIAKMLEGKVMPFIYQNKHVVTVSASSQKDIFDLGFTNANNIAIIPNGVDDSLYVDYPKTDHPSYIYLGRLKEYKNIDVAIKAFAKLLKVHNNATLSIVGTGESYPDLKNLVDALGIQDAVTFYGRVSNKEKARLLAQSWAAIQPSQMEGWGITVIEANAARTPVIASNVNGLHDSVVDGQTGLLVPAGNIMDFATAMQSIAEDHMLRMTLSEQALYWSRNFSWDKSAEDFYKLIGRNFGQGAIKPAYSNVVYSSREKGANK
jgi:glycosyltransferase XagB